MSASDSIRAVRAAISRAAREPLAQFMAAGLLLFIANALINGAGVSSRDAVITIPQGRVQQIAESYRLMTGRPPSDSELQALVNDFIDEEIYYREAIALGLDIDDTIIRRRLRQKLEFLVEDASALEEPDEQQLAEWLASHPDLYRLPARISFRHVLASADLRGVDAQAHAENLLFALRAGADPVKRGDASMLPSALSLTTQEGVAGLFGGGFASSLFNHREDNWFGPVKSLFGAHLVLITDRRPARDPAIDEVRERLKSDWIEAQRKTRREDFRMQLRERYQVNVVWPEADDVNIAQHDGAPDLPRREPPAAE